MATRTELILLQRTMVVVEGVARTLDPLANIFEAARPVVEDYIRDHLGPRALLRDAAQTVLILSRLGTRMPGLANEMLMLAEEARTSRSRPSVSIDARLRIWPYLFLGIAIGGLGGFVLAAL